jgi:hypothetical protein
MEGIWMHTSNRLDLWLHARLGRSSAARWAARTAALGIGLVLGVGALLQVIWSESLWYVGAAVTFLGISNAVWIWRVSAPASSAPPDA